MRGTEIAAVIYALVLIAYLYFRRRPRRNAWELGVTLCLVFAIDAFREGAHWQLIPLYLSALTIWFAGWADRHWPKWRFTFLALISILLICATGYLSWLMPMFQLPKPTGPYQVGTRIFHLVDTSRNEDNGPSPSGKRELMVQAWYPAELAPTLENRHLADYQRRKEVTLRASYRSVLKTNSYLDAAVRPGGEYPLLIYNPAWMGERTEGTYQMEELASHGFIVVAVDHTFFGGLVEFPDGRVTDSHNAPVLGDFTQVGVDQEWELGGKYVRIEAQDDIYVLDQLDEMNQDQNSPWYHTLDFSRVGAMGFSIGGAAAIQMAGQDPRVKAALDLDGWAFGDFAQQGLAKPLMVVYEDKSKVLPTLATLHSPDQSRSRSGEFAVEDFSHVTKSMTEHGGYLLYIAGTQHVDFSDRSLFSPLASLTGRGTVAPDRVHQIVNAYTLAFFTHVLNGEASPLLDANPAPFKEVEIEHFPGTAAKSSPDGGSRGFQPPE